MAIVEVHIFEGSIQLHEQTVLCQPYCSFISDRLVVLHQEKTDFAVCHKLSELISGQDRVRACESAHGHDGLLRQQLQGRGDHGVLGGNDKSSIRVLGLQVGGNGFVFAHVIARATPVDEVGTRVREDHIPAAPHRRGGPDEGNQQEREQDEDSPRLRREKRKEEREQG